jgi:hypothetical protein
LEKKLYDILLAIRGKKPDKVLLVLLLITPGPREG